MSEWNKLIAFPTLWEELKSVENGITYTTPKHLHDKGIVICGWCGYKSSMEPFDDNKCPKCWNRWVVKIEE